jgi:hypothetical protein
MALSEIENIFPMIYTNKFVGEIEFYLTIFKFSQKVVKT